MSFAIELADGRMITAREGAWSHGEAEQYLAELRRQADSDDGGDLIDVFGFSVENYSRLLAHAVIVPVPAAGTV